MNKFAKQKDLNNNNISLEKSDDEGNTTKTEDHDSDDDDYSEEGNDDYEKKFLQLKKDKLQFEQKLRSEMASKWSKRFEEQAKYYENQMNEQKAQIESNYLKRIDCLENNCKREYEFRCNIVNKWYNLCEEQAKFYENQMNEQKIQTESKYLKRLDRLENYCKKENDQKLQEIVENYKTETENLTKLLDKCKQDNTKLKHWLIQMQEKVVKLEATVAQAQKTVDVANNKIKTLTISNQNLSTLSDFLNNKLNDANKENSYC